MLCQCAYTVADLCALIAILLEEAKKLISIEIAMARFCRAGKGTSYGFRAGFLAPRHPKTVIAP